MSDDPGFNRIVEAIDAELGHLHKQRWNARATELHAETERAPNDRRELTEQALRDHYTVRFKPETSRAALLEQAAANYMVLRGISPLRGVRDDE